MLNKNMHIKKHIGHSNHSRNTVELQWLEHRWLVYHGLFDLIFESLRKFSDSSRKQILWEFFSFYYEIVCCVYSLESPHRGDSNEYMQHTIIC